MKFHFLLIFLLTINLSYSQFQFNRNSEDKFYQEKIEGTLLQGDLSQLRRTILSAHPNPFIYIGKSSWDSSYLELYNFFREPRTTFEFVQKTAPWLAQLKDSHVGFDLGQLLEQYKSGKSWLIFNLSQINEKFYANYFFENKIPHGNEIISINTVQLDSLFQLALGFAIQEGNSIEAKRTYATTLMPQLLNLMFSFDKEVQSIPVKHIDWKGDTMFSFVNTTPAKNRYSIFKKVYSRDLEDVKMEINKSENYGVLTLNTFLPENKKKYEKNIDIFFDSIFKEEISKIMIDIRWNRGGYFDYVEYLFNYIDTTELPRNKLYLAKRSKYDKLANMSKISKWIFMKYAKIQRTDKELQDYVRYFKLPYGAIDTLSEKNDFSNFSEKYRDTCFLAMNGISISASVDFASWFRTSQRGLIIGEECMGPITGTCGNPSEFKLNNTDISVITSTMRSYTNPNLEVALEPIKPDILLKESLENFRKKQDPIIDFLK